MKKKQGQLIAKYQGNSERDMILAELKLQGFKCGHSLVKLDGMNKEDLDGYFGNLPFVVDFSERVFFATNVTCLAAACSSEKGKKLFTETRAILEILKE
ncbi:MAG: hypothetical protein LBS99_00480 [Clostridiales bacterium]|jgi:hypothetical protein|nr:hypothetical protein [Clostridiales bacterium]